jgi:6-phosphogluconolactonase
VILRVCDDPEAAARSAAVAVARRLRRAVAERGVASVAFSGGRTPAAMLAHLATMPLAWDRLQVYQVDERLAPAGHPARNVGLLDVLPVAPRHLHAMPVNAADVRRAARRYVAALPERLDVVHLGLGADGHTASWPPGDPVVDSVDTVDLCAEYAGWVRMTLTPRAVNAARSRVVLAVGADKAPALEAWLGGSSEVPVARVHRRGMVVLVDRAAATAAVMAAAARRRR